MESRVFTYETRVAWETDRKGHLETAGRAALAVGAPVEFNGTDDVWSPEHLTAGAVNTCLMLTFIAIAGNSKLTFSGYSSSATATLEKVEGRGMVISKIHVRPRITVPPDTDPGRLDRVLKMTEKNCFISNSLNAAVIVEPEIVRQ